MHLELLVMLGRDPFVPMAGDSRRRKFIRWSKDPILASYYVQASIPLQELEDPLRVPCLFAMQRVAATWFFEAKIFLPFEMHCRLIQFLSGSERCSSGSERGNER